MVIWASINQVYFEGRDSTVGCSGWENSLGRFSAKWKPVRVKKTRQNKSLEPRSDSIGTEKALAYRASCRSPSEYRENCPCKP